MLGVLLLFAGIITFGVLYNAARISLPERHRELGALRVLGFTHREARGAADRARTCCSSCSALLPGIALGALFALAR